MGRIEFGKALLRMPITQLPGLFDLRRDGNTVLYHHKFLLLFCQHGTPTSMYNRKKGGNWGTIYKEKHGKNHPYHTKLSRVGSQP